MKKRLVCYGTSLTSTGGWVKMLKKRLPDWRVINSGEGGINSNWGLDNFGKKVLKYNPHVVLMEFAINDSYIKYDEIDYGCKPTSFDQSIQNIKFMIKKLKWCKVYYMTMNPPLDIFIAERNPAEDRPDYWLYSNTHQKVADTLGAEVIDMNEKWKALSTENFLEYCPDGLHPNEFGSEMITIPAIMEAIK